MSLARMSPDRGALLLALLVLALEGCRAHPRPCDLAEAPCTATGSLEHGGRSRTYLYHLPPGLRAGAPLVIALHGRLGQGSSQAKLTGLDAVADTAGFIVVYPDGVRNSWADGRGVTPADQAGVDDVGFLTALADSLVQRFEASAHHVFVTGMSNGGMMAYRLACDRADRFAAVATVGALMPKTLAARCAPSRPVPLLSFCGTDDPLIPIEGGETDDGRGDLLSAEQSRQTWARLDGCVTEPILTWEPDVDPQDGTRVRNETQGTCREGAEVRLSIIEGGGHTWPGGWQYLGERSIGRTSRDVNASHALWEFFHRVRP